MRRFILSLCLLVAGAAPAQAQLFCPNGQAAKLYDTGANWTASVREQGTTVHNDHYFAAHVDPGLVQVVWRTVARFAISHSSLRNRRVIHGFVRYEAARPEHVLTGGGLVRVIPTLYNGTGLGLDVTKGITAAQITQGIVVGLTAQVGDFYLANRGRGPYSTLLSSTALTQVTSAISQRAKTWSIAIEPLYRGVPPAQVPYQAALFRAPVLTLYHCAL